MLKLYLKRIFEVAKRGDAREESYYSCLEELLKNYSDSINKKHIQTTTLPKKTDAGNPDFRVWDGKQHIVGYIEAKAPMVEHLDQIKETEQLKRYLHTFPNLILTNFFEFRLYREGQLVDKVQIARPYVIHKLGTIPPVEKEKEFFSLLEKFFSFSLPKAYTAKTLAVELAKRTRFLKEQVIIEELKQEENKGKGNILGFYQAFQKFLIHGLTQEDFADLYSQTITYGLFAARTRAENGFNRRLAFDYIPQTIGILRDVFKFISLEDLPPQMEWIVDDISEILSAADVKQILHKFYHEGKGSDPIIHFYETFLAEYDPQAREKRGVYYTPEPVVSYIVRSLNIILKQYFGKQDGFASSSVTVLDPAAGTLTFLAEAAKLAVEEFISKYGEGAKEKLIKEHILKNFYAFELMMAPYAVGHLKMSFLLEELGYKLHEDDRFKLYLTNTLEMEELEQTALPGMASLSEESHLAGKVKKETPILVILGNPPYSVSSANKSKFIEGYFEKKEGTDKRGKKRLLNVYIRGILDDYKDDVKDETNIQPLSDDYIKFVRFAHWKIDNAGTGIFGMITNNSYISGLIHRGMRKRLLESFNEIYILNLHGNARIGEKAPGGGKDENVFDIMQGVSIALFVKDKIQKGFGKVFYQDIYGLREKKYEYLNKYDVKSIKWKKLRPSEPHYFFVMKDFAEEGKYNTFLSVQDIFIQSSSGVKTHRDHFVVGFTESEIKQKMRTFTSDLPDELIEQSLDIKDTRDWKLKTARESVKKMDWKDHIRSYSYRPFDNRYICYLPELIDRGCDRWDLMKNFFEENLGICVTRQLSTMDFLHAFVTDKVVDMCFVSIKTKETGYIFPLYLYQKSNPPSPPFSKGGKGGFAGSTMMLFEPQEEYGVKKPNLSPVLIEQLKKGFKKEPTPEQIFYYIYAVLYSSTYRTKYAEFLKIDFPRVPFTSDYKLFVKMGQLGERLVNLHLLRAKELDSPVARFQGKGDSRIEKLRYENPPSSPFSKGGKEGDFSKGRRVGFGRLYINPTQYFEGITPEVWEYQIGGYQVCEKWLKDRKGKALSLDDIKHYCMVATSIQKTIEIQKEIDGSYLKVEEKV